MPEVVIPSDLLTSGGWAAVLILTVLALWRGWLWTGGQVRMILAEKDRQIRDWREAYQTEHRRGDVLAENQEKAIAMLEALTAERASKPATDRAAERAGDRCE